MGQCVFKLSWLTCRVKKSKKIGDICDNVRIKQSIGENNAAFLGGRPSNSVFSVFCTRMWPWRCLWRCEHIRVFLRVFTNFTFIKLIIVSCVY